MFRNIPNARTKRRGYLISLLVAAFLLGIAVIILDRYCPPSGLPLTPARAEAHRLKNRTTLPQSSDFDSMVTLEAMLEKGHDEKRWSQTRAARIEGYVVSVGKAGIELANCYSPCRRDIHINLALRTNAPAGEQVVVEVTPNLQRSSSSIGTDWSEETLQRTLVGRWCRFQGWLFFDREHAKESTNTFEQGSDVWRATAWEIHPVTKIEVVQ
jgi:hypothetical protein